MRTLRATKVVLYPAFGFAQFFLLHNFWMAALLCAALCAVAILNLHRLLDSTKTRQTGP
jgi:hypothetical protein